MPDLLLKEFTMNCRIDFGTDFIIMKQSSYEEIFKQIIDVMQLNKGEREHTFDLIRTNKIIAADAYVRACNHALDVDFVID